MCTLVPYRPRRSPSPHPSNSSSICLQAAAAVMALLLGYGLVTLPEMLLQPPASVKQSLQHFSRRLPNALSKCSHPEQKLNIQGPQTITILSPLVFSFFFPSVNINFSVRYLSLLYCRYKTSTMQGCHLQTSNTLFTFTSFSVISFLYLYLYIIFIYFLFLITFFFFSLLSLQVPVSVLNWHRLGQDSGRLCREFG